MSDFIQDDIITTLHKLPGYSLEKLEEKIRAISEERKIVLLLPSLFSELEGEALPKILEELKEADYLHEVVISLDKADKKQFEYAREFFSVLPITTTIVWNDSPEIQGIYRELREGGLNPGVQGKGRGVWTGLGYILGKAETYMIALHDCDILTYSRDILARIIYPVLSKRLNYDFSKGYYARVTDRLHGRVVRLFFTPLVSAFKKILGYREFFEYMSSFRYPLAGEFAMVAELARRIRFSSDWGLEVSLLREVYNATSLSRICQVDLVDRYEHKHQGFRMDDIHSGVMRMAIDIARTFFRILSQEGIILDENLIRTLKLTYYDIATQFVDKYKNVTMINSLEYDRHSEIGAIEKFAFALDVAEAEFKEYPMGSPLIPTWQRVDSAIPDLLNTRLRDIVNRHNRRS
ncbi:glycosyl transferase [candidate division WOR-3 bacterium]|nr:glycosyl transferase [candidate division WOR-3 bacterium]MCK4526678.1 glycosyl transferase [candidate division WOR-3 bacterium]